MDEEKDMCLSTVYMDSGNEQTEIMKDVASIEAEGRGYWFINLFGERKFVEGAIQTVDLVDKNSVMLRKEKSDR
jgi:predicted RNA-binding protein